MISASSKSHLSIQESFALREGTTTKIILMRFWKHLFLNPFLRGAWKILVEAIALCCIVKWVFTFSLPLNCFIQIRKLGYVWSEPDLNFYMNIDNPNVSFGIVDCSLWTRRFALKDFDRRRMNMLAYTPVENKYLETLTKTFIIPFRQNQFVQKFFFNKAPVRRIASAIDKKSAIFEWYAESSFCYQQLDISQIEVLRAGQLILDFDAAEKCCLSLLNSL